MSHLRFSRGSVALCLCMCLGLFLLVTPVGAATGDISTVAGGGINEGGPASEAGIFRPWRVYVDVNDNIYIADWGGSMIQKIDAATGILTRAVGNGLSGRDIGESGETGPADQMTIRPPTDVAADSQENIYFNYQGAIWKADVSGTVSFVNSGRGPFRIDDNDNLYFRDGSSIKKLDLVTGASSVVVGGQRMAGPDGLSFDSAGNLYFANTWDYQVFKMSPTGTVSHLAGNGERVGENFEGTFSGDGGPAIQAGLHGTKSTAVDANNNVYLADVANFRIRRVDGITGILTTVAGNGVQSPDVWQVPSYSAGDGGPATDAMFGQDFHLAVDSSGDVYISDTHNLRVRKLDVDTGIITTFAGGGNNLRGPDGLVRDGAGNFYIAQIWANKVIKVAPSGETTLVAGTGDYEFSGDGGPGIDATLKGPRTIALDGSGNVYIADRDNHRIRKVDGATGVITTLAGNGVEGFSGDGGPATEASLRWPEGVSVDAAGNVYIADTENLRIRKVDAGTGIISTIAGGAEKLFAFGLSIDSAGNVVFADTWNNLVRKMSPAGALTIVAGRPFEGGGFEGDGGPATDALINPPSDAWVDGAGNVYISDESTHRIRKVDASGTITTVAGNGTPNFTGDGGPATDATLGNPAGVTADGSGNIYFADTANLRVRKVDAAGIITTVAGGGGSTADGPCDRG